MKLENLPYANQANNIIASIDEAIKEAEHLLRYQSKDPDRGGIPGVAEYGYNLHMSVHSDGSGHSTDMSRCYVGVEVAEATIAILKKKREKMQMYLISIGVKLPEDEKSND